MKLIAQPMLTLGLGPTTPSQTSSLFDQLPSFDLLDLYLLPGCDVNAQKGLKIATRHTHRITDLRDLKKVFSSFSSSTRQQIRKAGKKIIVEASEDIDLLYKMVSLTFRRQSKKAPYALSYAKRINDVCVKHKCRKILVARDEDKNVHGACFLAWDKQTAYYIMGGSDPKFRSSAAYSLLMWEAIQEASKHAAQFDFCGSSIASVAKFFKGFGGEETSYLHLRKVNSRALKLALALKGK